jgi:hypothetical protein
MNVCFTVNDTLKNADNGRIQQAFLLGVEIIECPSAERRQLKELRLSILCAMKMMVHRHDDIKIHCHLSTPASLPK